MAATAIPTDPVPLERGDVILFQGDSITDCGRARQVKEPNSREGLGHGYAFLLSSHLLMANAQKDLRIYNRGISGDRVPDLERRWERDCLAIEPDILSILVGVNDIGHKISGGYDGTVEDYEEGFTALLARTRQALPHATIIICEPFVLRCGAVDEKWFPEFDQRRAVARRVAAEAGTRWVAFQDAFDQAVTDAVRPDYWADDGVHPTAAGHALMAREWLNVFLGR